MKRNSTKKKAEKPAKLDEIDPLDDLDVAKLRLVARGRGWSTNAEEGKRRAQALTRRVDRDRTQMPKRRA